ncbi:hypothetical protein LSAT2_031815 [Lamellibrachia satsuma]|nr:hypothetical protein LSAT2_031815 [Lamellibrachia satsuma]
MAAHMLRVNQLLNPGRRRQHLYTAVDVLEMLSRVDLDAELSDDENVDDVADEDPDFLLSLRRMTTKTVKKMMMIMVIQRM